MTQIHPNQTPTSPELVRELLRSQYHSLADEPIADEPIHGTDNDVYRVGTRHSVRLPIIDWSVGHEAHIRPWLPLLHERLDVEVPQPEYYGVPGAGYPHPWTIYPWIEGETLPLGVADETAIRDIAHFVLQLQSLPTDGAPPAGRTPHEFDNEVRAALANLLSNEHPDELTAYWDGYKQEPGWDGTGAVWIHGDVQAGNLIFRDGRLVAVIDWAGLGAGDPVNDMQIAWNTFDRRGRELFRELLDVDDATWDRARARAFIQACFQLPYYRDSFPTMANQARYVLTQILDELEG